MSVLIPDPKVENKNILIYKQEIMEDVYCSNIIGRVQNGKMVVSVLNIAESETIDKFNLNKQMYGDDIELCSTHTVNMCRGVCSRLKSIKNLIRTEHENSEKR